MTDKQKTILNYWYARLDQDYGDHGDPDSSCPVCYEASLLNIIEDRIPEESED